VWRFWRLLWIKRGRRGGVLHRVRVVMLSGRSIGLRDSGAGFLLFAWFGLALFLHCIATRKYFTCNVQCLLILVCHLHVPWPFEHRIFQPYKCHDAKSCFYPPSILLSSTTTHSIHTDQSINNQTITRNRTAPFPTQNDCPDFISTIIQYSYILLITSNDSFRSGTTVV
jgi:hypothetical protein